MSKLEVYAERQIWQKGIALHIVERNHGEDSFSVAKPIEFEARRGDDVYLPSTEAILLPDSAAQMLIDELWKAGVRPTEGAGSAGSLAATERHLKDMQKIAFKKLNIE